MDGGVGATKWVITAVCRDSQLLQRLTEYLLSNYFRCRRCQLPVWAAEIEELFTLYSATRKDLDLPFFFLLISAYPRAAELIHDFSWFGGGFLVFLFFERVYKYSNLIGFQWWGVLDSRKPCQQCRMRGFSLDKTLCLDGVWTGSFIPVLNFLKGFPFSLFKNFQFSCRFAVIAKLIWHTKWSWRWLSFLSLNLCSASFTAVECLDFMHTGFT